MKRLSQNISKGFLKRTFESRLILKTNTWITLIKKYIHMFERLTLLHKNILFLNILISMFFQKKKNNASYFDKLVFLLNY